MSEVTIGVLRAADRAEQLAYERGAEDMREAIRTLYNAIDDDLSCSTIKELFSTIYIRKIVEDTVATDIITRIKHWKEIKKLTEEHDDLDFKIGDEVVCVNPCYINYGKKYVVVQTSITGEENDYMRMISINTLTNSDTLHIDFYRKTGKHYDSIPIPKGENK